MQFLRRPRRRTRAYLQRQTGANEICVRRLRPGSHGETAPVQTVGDQLTVIIHDGYQRQFSAAFFIRSPSRALELMHATSTAGLIRFYGKYFESLCFIEF